MSNTDGSHDFLSPGSTPLNPDDDNNYNLDNFF